VNARGRRPGSGRVKRILSGSVLQLQHKKAAKQCPLCPHFRCLLPGPGPSDTGPSAGHSCAWYAASYRAVTRFVPVTFAPAAHQGNEILPSALSCMSRRLR